MVLWPCRGRITQPTFWNVLLDSHVLVTELILKQRLHLPKKRGGAKMHTDPHVDLTLTNTKRLRCVYKY